MGTRDVSVLDATRRLLEATSYVTGERFFHQLARATAEVLGVRWALVGQRLDGDRIQTRAVWDTDRIVADFRYDLEGTPCADVLERGLCSFPREVQRQFPRDALLRTMGVESYTGLRLRDAGGHATGVLIALHDRPTEADPELATILALFADRAGLELDREDGERRLRASEARYRQIVTTCGEGVWVVDAEGRTTFANQQLATMLRVTPEALLGRSMYDLMDDEGRRQAAANMSARKAGVAARHEFRWVLDDGSELWTSMAATPLHDEQGAFTGALALVTDITAQRELARKLQQKDKLESLGLLAGGVAHDFNNLLVGILGNVGAVRPALQGAPGAAAAAAALDDIETAARRAAELARQLLTYGGQHAAALAPLDLNALVAETQRLVQPSMPPRASLDLQLAPGLPAVDADPTQLRQVVMNLVTNARDALGDAGGAITIATRRIHATRAWLDGAGAGPALPEGDYVVVEVGDTGSGMDPATLARIFDPFFSTKASGRGLGLAAVLGILRGHGGGIRVTSTPGRGSTFTVLLPASSAAAPAADAPASEAAHAAHATAPTVLVIDDERVVSTATQRILEAFGYDVLVADDGPSGVATFVANPQVRAVLLDVSMPGMSGPEVFRALRALRPDVRVILCSGYDRAVTAASVDQGVTAVLEKPWTLDQLVATIEHAVGDHRA